MKYQDYKASLKPCDQVLENRGLSINTQQEYLDTMRAVNNYTDRCYDSGSYEFTKADFDRFTENLQKCIDCLTYTDDVYPESELDDILKCAEILGWGPKSAENALDTIHHLFESCMNMGCPKMSAETGGWVVECDIIDHEVTVYWKVGGYHNYDNEY